MMYRTLTLIAVSLALCAGAAAATPQSQAKPGMLVQTDWLAAHLNDHNIVILHVGADRGSYDAGHIPGARFLAIGDIAVTRNGIPNELPPANDLKAVFERLGVGDQSRVVLYGERSGVLAARVYFTLDYLGRGANASLLDGGLEKWRAESRNTSNAPGVAGKPAVLTVKPHPELLVELPALKPIVSEKKLALIDARPPTDYSGVVPANGVARSGHIPGAKNVFWMDNLVSRDIPVLKPLPEIRARYAAAGVKPGAKTIVYCHTGMQAAHDYFTLKLAGFSPVLYDASFIDWGNAAGVSVETGTGR